MNADNSGQYPPQKFENPKYFPMSANHMYQTNNRHWPGSEPHFADQSNPHRYHQELDYEPV